MITKEFDVYLGNLSNEPLSLLPCELFGFSTGAFEVKEVKGGAAACWLKIIGLPNCQDRASRNLAHCRGDWQAIPAWCPLRKTRCFCATMCAS